MDIDIESVVSFICPRCKSPDSRVVVSGSSWKKKLCLSCGLTYEIQLSCYPCCGEKHDTCDAVIE